MEDELLEDEDELLLDNEQELLIEETPHYNDGDLLLSEDEETLFSADPVNNSSDHSGSSDTGSIETTQPVSDALLNIQNDLETVEESVADPERVGVDDSSNDEDILQSLQIIQRNVKTGFDNLSLMGSVHVGLISFGIGAIIIYCYIGRFK